jgi:hypothetical protein
MFQEKDTRCVWSVRASEVIAIDGALTMIPLNSQVPAQMPVIIVRAGVINLIGPVISELGCYPSMPGSENLLFLLPFLDSLNPCFVRQSL